MRGFWKRSRASRAAFTLRRGGRLGPSDLSWRGGEDSKGTRTAHLGEKQYYKKGKGGFDQIIS